VTNIRYYGEVISMTDSDNRRYRLRNCKGCRSEEQCSFLIYYHEFEFYKYVCPCSTCLVKAMCSRMCEERDDLYQLIYRDYAEKHKRAIKLEQEDKDERQRM
jgi:hypothetical protein